jgi:RNAse (barnase) inhibitor barstar
MEPLTKQLSDAERSGVYQLTREPEEVEHAAKNAGLAVFRINIHHVRSKKQFLEHAAKALNFPEWFGGNWDALNDCLTDLDWVPNKDGFVLIFEHAEDFGARHQQEFENANAVFRAASEFWKAEGRPFWTFITVSSEWDSGLSKWPHPGSP